jgi:hypothetical protein
MAKITDKANTLDWIEASRNFLISSYPEHVIASSIEIKGAFSGFKVVDISDQPKSIFTMIASETVLGKDWNTPQEEAAWRDL